MSSQVLFVSIRQTFDPKMRLSQLESWVARAWAISVAKANSADRVVAVVEGQPVAAWELRGAYQAKERYFVASGDSRPRVALALGSPLPVLLEYCDLNLTMRRGVTLVELDVPPLPEERAWVGIEDPVQE